MWALIRNGKVVERHPHKLTCIIAAFERGMVMSCKGRLFLLGELQKLP